MTLEIRVDDVISVLDKLGQALVALVKKLLQLFTEPEEPVAEEQESDDDNKSPPTLGINVSDDVGAGEAFG